MNRHQLWLAHFVDEARAPGQHVEGIAVAPINTGARRRIAAVIVQTVQFLFQVVGGDRRTDVQLERCREHPCRHRPVPSLKFPGDRSVEVNHPNRNADGEDECRGTQEDEKQTPATKAGAGHRENSSDRQRSAFAI
jgi:hypothetical protein